eukprot:531713-Pleurochrysis_carterae.AAC.1
MSALQIALPCSDGSCLWVLHARPVVASTEASLSATCGRAPTVFGKRSVLSRGFACVSPRHLRVAPTRRRLQQPWSEGEAEGHLGDQGDSAAAPRPSLSARAHAAVLGAVQPLSR